jgi:phage/plasmid-associated DNA primase
VHGAYKPDVVKFRPHAFHILAGNILPAFLGGFDRGVNCRLAVIGFNRVIPMDERIDNIGEPIARQEGQWAPLNAS